MRLTGPQIRTLRWHVEHRNKPPTLGGFFRDSARIMVLWIACAIFCIAYFTFVSLPEGAYVCGGAFLGAILREVRQYRWAVSVWPAIAAVMDWERAERLVAEAENQS